jgi:hypothetical protein
MEVVRLKPGERAPEGADRIHIHVLPNGKAGWDGSVAFSREAVFGVSENSERLADDAEAEAIEWARGHGATELFVERD